MPAKCEISHLLCTKALDYENHKKCNRKHRRTGDPNVILKWHHQLFEITEWPARWNQPDEIAHIVDVACCHGGVTRWQSRKKAESQIVLFLYDSFDGTCNDSCFVIVVGKNDDIS